MPVQLLLLRCRVHVSVPYSLAALQPSSSSAAAAIMSMGRSRGDQKQQST
jgi:hypothetical protein